MFNFVYKDIDFQHKLDEAGYSSEVFEKHIHPFDEIVYFIYGNVTYTVEAESHKLKPGDVIFIPAGMYHFATVDTTSKYERCVLKFPDSYIPEYIKDVRKHRSCFIGNEPKYLNIFNRLDKIKGSFNNDELYAICLCDTIRILVEIYHSSTPPTQSQEEVPEVIRFLIDYINNNLDKKITLDLLSEVSNFSKSYISNSFKLYMKAPIIQYVRTKKILAAHQMIENGAKPYQVAKKYGFDDYSTFYRSYVSIIGVAPANNNLSS